jgi:hypothetical protein
LGTAFNRLKFQKCDIRSDIFEDGFDWHVNAERACLDPTGLENSRTPHFSRTWITVYGTFRPSKYGRWNTHHVSTTIGSTATHSASERQRAQIALREPCVPQSPHRCTHLALQRLPKGLSGPSIGGAAGRQRSLLIEVTTGAAAM